MELSVSTQRYDLIWTRSEPKPAAEPAVSASDSFKERYEQQMKTLEDARALLKQLPDKKTSERRGKSEKTKMLKDRLNMLKQMLPFMSSSAAKSLKAEMKQIASQMASLATGSAGSIGSFSAPGFDTTDGAQTGIAAESSGAGTPETVAGTAALVDRPAPDEETAAETKTDTTDKGTIDKTSAGNEEERLFKESLGELKRLFKQVHAMVQRKLQQEENRGEALPDIPSQLQVYAVLPETGNNITVNA